MLSLQRRRFLYGLGAVGACAAASTWSAWRGEDGEANEAGEVGGRRAYSRSSWALGATVSMTVLHRDRAAAEAACDAAFAELEQVERLMSIYRADSQVSRLNQRGMLRDPHPLLVEVLRAARRTSERTQGAFDITVQPLWELYSQSAKKNLLPSEAEVACARRLVDWRRVEVQPSGIRLRGKGTRITLNGIAQGFAADRARLALRRHGVRDALIDTGEISALGAAESSRDAWRVGVQHPRDSQAYVALTDLSGRCLATSGDYATSFSPDHRHHHLFDPRRGDSPVELCSVSIAADTALEADALSTAVFVLGLEAGSSLVRQTEGASAMLVTRSGRVVLTPGFPLA